MERSARHTGLTDQSKPCTPFGVRGPKGPPIPRGCASRLPLANLLHAFGVLYALETDLHSAHHACGGLRRFEVIHVEEDGDGLLESFVREFVDVEDRPAR